MLTLKRPKVNQFTGCFFLKGLFKIDRLLFIFAMRKECMVKKNLFSFTQMKYVEYLKIFHSIQIEIFHKWYEEICFRLEATSTDYFVFRPSDMTVTSLSDYRIFLEVGIRQNYLLFNVQSVGDDSVRSLAQSSKHPYKEIMLHQK